MAIERAAVLYLRNSTTVDTGSGIDIRLLDDTNAGVADLTQTFTFTHTQDSIERTFDPATAVGAGNTNNAGTTLFKTGWALRLADDMTPVDDTNCNAYLPAGDLTVNLQLRSNQTGGTYISGNFVPTVRASLWRYNPSTDTGTIIAAGSAGATWAVTGGTNNTFQTIAVPISIAAAVEFAAGEILYLQAGMNSNVIPNPTLGTGTFTITLEVDTSLSNITWAANQSIKQICVLSASLIGKGAPTRVVDGGIPRTTIGKGVPTESRAVVASKSFSLVGKGDPTHSKVTAAARSFSLDGRGTVTKGSLPITMEDTVIGKGEVVATKATTAAKSFTLVGMASPSHTKAVATTQPTVTGSGTATGTKVTNAARSFDVVGKGEVLKSSSIAIPIDEIPEGGGGTTIIKKSTFIFDD